MVEKKIKNPSKNGHLAKRMRHLSSLGREISSLWNRKPLWFLFSYSNSGECVPYIYGNFPRVYKKRCHCKLLYM